MVNSIHTPTSTKKATNITLDGDLLREARDLGVNVSRAAEQGVQQAVAHMRAERWQQENADALQDYNDWVTAHGLPLAKYRQF